MMTSPLNGFTAMINQLLSHGVPINRMHSQREAYSRDQSSYEGAVPSAIVFPRTASEIEMVIIAANQHHTRLTVRGAGTGKAGATLMDGPHVVLSTAALTRIVDMDMISKTISVEPGVCTQDIQTEAAKHGLYYPPDPASQGQCSIGGNVATNAGGPHAFKYGVTGDYVLGLSGFWGSGEPFSYGGKRLKDVAGYDLKRLLIGSEGTLGVVSQLTLRLIEKPLYYLDCLFAFSSIEQGLAMLMTLYRAHSQPCLLEWIDGRALRYAHAQTPLPFLPCGDSLVYVLVGIDGSNQPLLTDQLATIQAYGHRYGGQLCQPAPPSWLPIRATLSTALKQSSMFKRSDDIVVPPSALPDTIRWMNNLKTPLTVIGYGHAGDGNIHVNILCMDPTYSHQAWTQESARVQEMILRHAVEVGGSITGEHGVGRTKAHAMPWMFDNPSLHLMKTIKQTVDPNSVLPSCGWWGC